MTDKEIEKDSYKAMESFRARDKQNDHLHPWVAYREGYLDYAKHMQPKIAELEGKLKVAKEILKQECYCNDGKSPPVSEPFICPNCECLKKLED